MLFANDVELYDQMFGEKSEFLDEEDIEHVVPESDEDFNKLIKEMRQIGIID